MTANLHRDAANGDPYACLALAYFMQTGKEFDQDFEESVLWFGRAAELGCARAHWEIYSMIAAGVIEGHDAEALCHLEMSAELGNVEAQMTLGDEYGRGTLVEKNLPKAFDLFKRAAEQGHSLAKFAVGYMYAHGLGVERSGTEAEMWYSSAGITGNADMFLRIGMDYEYGLNGVVHNEVEAARWYKLGADMGHDKCVLCLDAVLASLGGAPKEIMDDRLDRLAETLSSRETAMREAAVEEADYLLGEGMDEEAYEMYSKAADLGSPQAMFSKAMMRHQGLGVRRDDIDAIAMLSRAADAGSEDAQFYLARTYESSRYPTDESQIIKLYADAAANGFLAAYYYLAKYEDHPERYVRRTHMRR